MTQSGHAAFQTQLMQLNARYLSRQLLFAVEHNTRRFGNVVEDLDRLMTDLKGKGVTFKSDVIHSPVCRMAVCLDSEGNSILLHQLKSK
jgi:predicted enzyme related to lactoylglutathione lyase